MNRFLQYINEVLESLDIHTSISTSLNTRKPLPRTHSKKKHLENK